jgi:hypothetical protein
MICASIAPAQAELGFSKALIAMSGTGRFSPAMSKVAAQLPCQLSFCMAV